MARASMRLTFLCATSVVLAGPARLPGFHTCVGGGGDKHDKSWYEEKGRAPQSAISSQQILWRSSVCWAVLPAKYFTDLVGLHGTRHIEHHVDGELKQATPAHHSTSPGTTLTVSIDT